MQQRKFNPGDKVRILPSWWDHLESIYNAQHNSYVQRGKDHVYVVERCEDGEVYLTCANGWWNEDKLVPAFSVEESESEISIDGLI